MTKGADYPREKQPTPECAETVTVQNKLENGLELQRLQETFLGLDISSDEEMENDTENVGENRDDEDEEEL